MSLEATRALKSTDAGAGRTRPRNYMTAARQLRSETVATGAGRVLARTAEAIRRLLVASDPAQQVAPDLGVTEWGADRPGAR